MCGNPTPSPPPTQSPSSHPHLSAPPARCQVGKCCFYDSKGIIPTTHTFPPPTASHSFEPSAACIQARMLASPCHHYCLPILMPLLCYPSQSLPNHTGYGIMLALVSPPIPCLSSSHLQPQITRLMPLHTPPLLPHTSKATTILTTHPLPLGPKCSVICNAKSSGNWTCLQAGLSPLISTQRRQMRGYDVHQ